MPPRKSRLVFLGPRTLAGRITLTFLVAGLLITVLAAFISESFFRAQRESDTSSRLEHDAKLVATMLSRDLAERVDDLQRVAASPLLVDGQADPATLRSMLDQTREDLGLAWLAVVNPVGRVVVASGGHLEATSVAETSWFVEGRARLYIGNDLIDPSLSAALEENVRFMPIAIPYKNAQGNLTGVLVAQQYLTYNTASNALPPRAARDGIFASAYAEESGRWILGSAGAASKKPLPAPRGIKTSQYWRENYDGVDYLMKFARTSAYRGVVGPTWLVAVRQPTERVFAPARALRGRILQWGSALTFVCAILVAISLRQLSARIRSIALSAAHIRRGADTTATIPVFPGQDDFSDMSAKLNDLVDYLRNEGVTREPKSKPLLPRGTIPPKDSTPEYVRPSGTDPRRVLW